jgi:chitin synthase
MVVKEAANAVEEVPSTRTRRIWLWIVWATTWYIPSYLLKVIGRMKRPDVRLAWREKFTIFWLIFLANALIIFYIIGFGKLLCPQFDKAWLPKEVAQHTESNDWWAAVQGRVYDLTDFVHGDHSALLVGIPSNGPDTLEVLAGQDLTYYFPPPLSRACQGLVESQDIFITPKNFTPFAPPAQHISGVRTMYPTTDLRDQTWYETTFNTKLNKYYKGPLVWSKKEIKEMASQQDNPK